MTQETIYAWYSPTTDLICPICRSDIDQQILDDQAVLFDPVTEATFRLNHTALDVWQACHEKQTYRSLAQQLAEQYAIHFAHALEDVEQLIALFTQHGLMQSQTQEAKA